MTSEGSGQTATVTFDAVASAQSASFLSGAVIRDSSIVVTPLVPSDGTGGFEVAPEEEEPKLGTKVRTGLVSGLASMALMGSKGWKKVKEVDDKVGVSRAAEKAAAKAAVTARKVDSKLHVTEGVTVASAAVGNAASRIDGKLGISTKSKAVGQSIKETTVAQKAGEASRKANASLSSFNGDVKAKINEKRLSQELPSPPDIPPGSNDENDAGNGGEAPTAPPPPSETPAA